MFARLSSAVVFVFLMFTVFTAAVPWATTTVTVVCLFCTTVSSNQSNIQYLDPYPHLHHPSQPVQYWPHPVLQLCSRGLGFVLLIPWKCLTWSVSQGSSLPVSLLLGLLGIVLNDLDVLV